MHKVAIVLLWVGVVLLLSSAPVQAKKTVKAAESTSTPAPPAADEREFSGFGVHFGVGTDVQLGLGFGGGVSYVFFPEGGSTGFEFGPDLFFHSSVEEYDDYNWHYKDTTSLQVFGVRANALFGYTPGGSGIYWVAGTGFAAVAVDWESVSTYTPDPRSRVLDGAHGTAGGWILNLGVGSTLGAGWDVRMELPVLFLFSNYGKAAAIAPTLTLVAGLRF